MIDLKEGRAVLGQRGKRDRYKPLSTALCADSDPLAVARAYLDLHPFEAIYLADLDAIQGRGNHDRTIAALEKAFPAVTFWVDRGAADHGAGEAWLSRHRGRLIVGSESQQGPGLLTRLRGEQGDARLALSLDFRGDHFLGPPVLLEKAPLWPEDVIVMTLVRVGSGEGPDLRRLKKFMKRRPDRRFYAAGGVRNAADLERLAKAGAAGALVASCLHDGRVGKQVLARLAGS